MKDAITVAPISSAAGRFRLPQFACHFARQIIGIFALLLVLWAAGCGAMSSTPQTNGSIAPAITANPTSVTVNAGATATFTAEATGSPAPVGTSEALLKQ